MVRGRLATSVPINFLARELCEHVATLEREIAELAAPIADWAKVRSRKGVALQTEDTVRTGMRSQHP